MIKKTLHYDIKNQILKSNLTFFLFFVFLVINSILGMDVTSFSPDSYYYFTIARNFVNGNGLTFDNYEITTGFHPLWFLIVSMIAKFTHSIETFLKVVYLTQNFLFIIAFYFLYHYCSKANYSIKMFFFISIPLFLVNINIFLSGVENTLQFLLLCIFLWLFSQNNMNKVKNEILISVVLVFLYFSRLDTIFLLAIYYFFFLYKTIINKRYLTGLIHVSFVGSIVLTHFSIMYYFFGSIYPTSSLAIKNYLSLGTSSNFLQAISPQEHILTERLIQFFTKIGFDISLDDSGRYIGLVVPLVFLLNILLIIKTLRINYKTPLLMIGGMAVIQFLYYANVSNGWMRQWYFNGWMIISVFGFIIFFSKYLHSFFRFKNKLTFQIILIFFPLFLMLFVKFYKNTNKIHDPPVSWKYFYKESQILLNYNKNDYRLVGFTPDRATYFSGVGITHLEGLVNGYDFIDNYLPNNLLTYLTDIKATHFIISNSNILPREISSKLLITSDLDKNQNAIGILDKRNNYIAIYKISYEKIDNRIKN